VSAARGESPVRVGGGTLIVLVLVTLVAAASASTESNAAQGPPPNVVVLETDDQTVDELQAMPNVKRLLGDAGVTFDNSFVSFALCCPSRATFLTGQYAHNHGVVDNEPPGGGFEKLDGSSTLPVWLQRAGYYTALVGKYLNGYGKRNPTEIPPGWSEWHGAIDPSTYHYYGYDWNENGTVVHYGTDPGSYQTYVDADKAVDVIRRRASSSQPLFLWVTFLAPHYEHGRGVPVAPIGQAVPDVVPPSFSSPAFNETDVSDKPQAVRSLTPLSADETAWIKQNYDLELASLAAVDGAVARIVEALRASGTLDRTVIVFTSDNGFFHGEHRIKREKILPYEPSIRVPLLMRGPGIPAGRHVLQPVANVDLAPTIVDLAGARASLRTDGRSLVPLFRDPGLRWGRDLLIEGPGTDAGSLQFTGIRTPRYLYVEWRNGDRELYDLVRDPDELASRHSDPAYATVRDDLARRLARLRSCTGSSCLAGPVVGLLVRVSGNCRRRSASARLVGRDTASVTRVDFSLNRRRVAVDRSRPFDLSLAVPPRGATLRARAIFADGREVTEDRLVGQCR
jgi:arylsulfatase A-like enzyme